MQKPGANAGVKSSRERTRSHQNTRSGRHDPSPATYSARTERIDMFDKATIRNDFPILAGEAYGHALVYLDNAATTQVPAVVLDAVAEHYRTSNANVHRGMHYLAHRSTQGYESARIYFLPSHTPFLQNRSVPNLSHGQKTTDRKSVV